MKPQQKEFAYGLDFGTSKTALARARCNDPNPHVKDIMLCEARDEEETASCLLVYRETREIAGFGTMAVHDYLFMEPSEQECYELIVNFKPHIHQQEEAEWAARQFFAGVVDLPSVANDFARNGEVAALAVGKPASWPPCAEKLVRELLTEKGYPNPVCLPEPIGALFYHLSETITAEDAKKDILVVDWGAGTCDFTIMRDGQLNALEHWGSNIFGGRLFDDLFYQWIAQSVRTAGKHVAALDRIQANPTGKDTFLALIIAREVKEDYSNWLRGAKKWPYRYRHSIEVGDATCHLGAFVISDPGEFERRARNFVPTKRCRKWSAAGAQDSPLTDIDQPFLATLLADQPTDLLAWGEALIQRGVQGLRPDRAPLAILAGGSTRWPWFEEAIKKTLPFQGREKWVLTDPKPALTIAQGLCRAVAISIYAGTLVDKLGAVKAELITALRDEFVAPRYASFAQGIVTLIMGDRGPKIREALHKWQNWGSAETAREQLESIMRDWLSSGGKEKIRADVESINHAAEKFIWTLARKHDIKVEGLLERTADIYRPVRKDDWSEEILHVIDQYLTLSFWEEVFRWFGELLSLAFHALQDRGREETQP